MIFYDKKNNKKRRNRFRLFFVELVLFCVLDASRFPDDVDFDLSGIFEFGFQFLCDLFREEYRSCVVYLFGFYDNTYLSTRLDGV